MYSQSYQAGANAGTAAVAIIDAVVAHHRYAKVKKFCKDNPDSCSEGRPCIFDDGAEAMQAMLISALADNPAWAPGNSMEMPASDISDKRVIRLSTGHIAVGNSMDIEKALKVDPEAFEYTAAPGYVIFYMPSIRYLDSVPKEEIPSLMKTHPDMRLLAENITGVLNPNFVIEQNVEAWELIVRSNCSDTQMTCFHDLKGEVQRCPGK
jgi:hypothetical protein